MFDIVTDNHLELYTHVRKILKSDYSPLKGEAVGRRCSKKFQKKKKKSQENTCARVTFLITLQAQEKRDSDTVVFL